MGDLKLFGTARLVFAIILRETVRTRVDSLAARQGPGRDTGFTFVRNLSHNLVLDCFFFCPVIISVVIYC